MVKTAGAEVLTQPIGQSLVLPEDDAFDHATAHAAESGDRGARQPRVEPIGHAAEPATPTDDAPLLRAEHRVDPVMSQPSALVEAVRRAPRGAELTDQRKAGSLRRRAAER